MFELSKNKQFIKLKEKQSNYRGFAKTYRKSITMFFLFMIAIVFIVTRISQIFIK